MPQDEPIAADASALVSGTPDAVDGLVDGLLRPVSRLARVEVSIQLLNLLLRLPDDVTVCRVEQSEQQRKGGLCEIMLCGDGLPPGTSITLDALLGNVPFVGLKYEDGPDGVPFARVVLR